MFEFRVGRSRREVAALFGDGLHLIERFYVEDPDTGSLLIAAGGLGPEQDGGVYVLRWHGRAIGLEFRVTRRDDEHGRHSLLTLTQLGTSDRAQWARVPPVELTPEEATRAMHVAAEASVVYESYLGHYGPGCRVRDPLDPEREISPVDLGYDEIARASLEVLYPPRSSTASPDTPGAG